MNSRSRSMRILGIAFLLQFVTSVTSGLAVQPALIVYGDIVETMTRIANHSGLMRLGILLDVGTALGVILLGAMLYVVLKKENERVALVALGFYIVEGALLGASKGQSFSLLRASQEYAAAGQPAYLQTMAALAFESADFVGFTLHMLAFCLGGILFYYLLYRSGAVPRALSLWGLITMVPLLGATVLSILGVQAPNAVGLPYMPFEFVVGIWIAVKGVRAVDATQASVEAAGAALVG